MQNPKPEGGEPTYLFRHGELARRLGIEAHRVHIDVKQDGRFVSVSFLVDGRDLSPEHERIALAYYDEVTEGNAPRLPSIAGKA